MNAPFERTWARSVGRDLLRIALAEGLGVAEEHAQVLVVMIEHQGELLTSVQCRRLINPHRPIKVGAFQERIRALREVMGRDAIAGWVPARSRELRLENGQFRFGTTTYSLSEEGLLCCQAALNSVAARLPLQRVGASLPLRTVAEKAS